MSGFRLTESQRAAVETRGEAILVSAGAGSGKTRVLVERLMAYITDEKAPKDIDSFLIITYTRAAAAELRDRISRRLGELCAENPTDRRLRRQAALCARAQIGTIHSFCTSLLREHAHSLGIAPDFRVADEERCAQLRALALDKVLEKAYAHIQSDGDFRALADTVGAGRDDSRLEAVVLELYQKMTSHIYPEQWAAECLRALDAAAGASDAGQTVWGRSLLADAAATAAGWAQRMEALASEADAFPRVAAAYGESLRATALSLRDLSRAAADGWDSARAQLPIDFPRLKSLRAPEDEALPERIKALRELCKKASGELAERFSETSAETLSALCDASPASRALLKLTLDFSRAYDAEKRRCALLDFSDLEHLSVRLLLDRETGAPTQAAKEAASRFTEIMVDEYQDVNAVQDAIFTAVSREGKNLFMVGDVKQSIYRFRLADPTIFLRKYDAFGRGEGGRRILLRENFRSRPEVLHAVNHVFGSIMSRALGELDYDENARLIAGGEFPEAEGKSVFCLLAQPETDDEDAPDTMETEALAVARQIRALVDAGTPVAVEDGVRPMQWGDIAVLMRSPGKAGGAGAVFRRVMEAQGIPVDAAQGGDFFSSPETTVMLHLLAVTDNPRQDLPLISVLRSPLFAFTADELAAVRAEAPRAEFYDALCLRAEKDEKCRAFLDTLASLRQDAQDLPLGAFVWSAYARTDALAAAAAMPGGAEKRENLLRLFTLAERFEESGSASPGSFVRHLTQLRERGEEPAAAAVKNGSAVHLMSIHKSKGLEFPVVFLSRSNAQFNKRDARAEVTVHAQLGLGMKCVDLARGLEYPCLSYAAVSRRLLLEGLSEEMRVLYVGMTRAKERLYITGALPDPEKKLDKLRAGLSVPMEPCVLERAQSASDWLLSAFLLPDSPVEIGYADARAAAPKPSAAPEAVPAETAETGTPDVAALLDYRYPHAAAAALPVKLTATEIKSRLRARDADGEAQRLYPREKRVFRSPLSGGEKALSGAEKGTATHLLLQHIRPEAGGSAEGIASELARLVHEGRLTQTEADAVDRGAVERFFGSETGALLQSGYPLLREQRFSLLTDAGDFFPAGKGEELLLQGVVDCCVVEDDGLTVLDFKTDRVSGEALARRAEDYTPQLRAYAHAMRRLTGKRVKRCCLVFLFAGETVELPPESYAEAD